MGGIEADPDDGDGDTHRRALFDHGGLGELPPQRDALYDTSRILDGDATDDLRAGSRVTSDVVSGTERQHQPFDIGDLSRMKLYV